MTAQDSFQEKIKAKAKTIGEWKKEAEEEQETTREYPTLYSVKFVSLDDVFGLYAEEEKKWQATKKQSLEFTHKIGLLLKEKEELKKKILTILKRMPWQSKKQCEEIEALLS